jgi:hypothetical protein
MLITQYRENYGAHTWDGKGECPQYWKSKGGMEYFIPLGDTVNTARVQALAGAATDKLYRSNDAVEEYVVDWFVVEDNYLTPFEMDQLDYEGVIRYSPKEVTL